MITQEYLKSILHYDPETGVFTWRDVLGKRAHRGRIAGYCVTFISGKTYNRIRIDGKMVFAHRLAWLYVYGYFPLEVDHINGDGTDNRLSNLREVCRLENGKNLRLKSNNISGINGVRKVGNKWRAEIMVNSIHIHLGYFHTIIEAKKARELAEQKYGFHPNHGSNRPL